MDWALLVRLKRFAASDGDFEHDLCGAQVRRVVPFREAIMNWREYLTCIVWSILS